MTKEEFKEAVQELKSEVDDLQSDLNTLRAESHEFAAEVREHDPKLAALIEGVADSITNVTDYVKERAQ